MSRHENPPFARGETFYNGGTIDSNNLGGVNLEGKIYEFEDDDLYNAGLPGARPARSGRLVKCMIVRNVAAIALLPKRLVTLKKTGTKYLGQIDGYVTTTADRCYPLDEFLPAAGVPINDLCYIVIEGPATVLTDLAGADNDNFAVGGVVVGLTAATSGCTTAGRPAPQDLTGATALLGAQIQNRIGRALSAKTTANTNADLLIDVGKW